MSSFVLPLEAASIADCSIIVVLSARRICSYLSLSDNPVIEQDIRAPAVQFMYLKGRCRFVRNVQAVAITLGVRKNVVFDLPRFFGSWLVELNVMH